MPERAGWNKRTVLWNMHDVYPTFLKAPARVASYDYIIVVEGFKAAMWLWQARYRNVVALLGSYLSWEHEWLLTSLGCPVYLFLDNNDAGREGQADAGKRLSRSIPVVKMVRYPERLINVEKAQPDSLVVKELKDQIDGAPSYLEWKLSLLRRPEWHLEKTQTS